MKVERINIFTPQKTARQNKLENKQNYVQNNTYNPIAYNDYNVNFTARLFRTPENFYAQPFNMNGMPDLMRTYLLDDFEDRRKMPPAQMLGITYDDINETSNLEQVKKIFSKEDRFEPLFQNLTDVPNRKVRTGVIAEIDLMKEEGKTLFKNGKDNLGHYILKKIYLEGKSLKEINKDFKRDISVHYNGLSPIGYETLSAYGIKFPNNGFWKSLLATREEFPYEYKPRKANARSVSYQKTDIKKTVNYRPKNKFDGMKDWEIDKITDAFVKGNGSSSDTVKHLKRTGVKDEAPLNFVAKYMGEINSIVLEKLHISPDMKDFFENYDGLSKNQKQKFTEYMRMPEINEWRSKVMQSTIRTFFDSYGVDGNNEEFKQLLDYAHNIKPNRIQEAAEHAKRQAYYDEIFAQQPEVSKNGLSEETKGLIDKIKTTIQDTEDFLKEVEKHTYKFKTSKGNVSVIAQDLRKALADSIREAYDCFPSAYVEKFIRFVKERPYIDDKYILTSLLAAKNIEIPEDERLLSKEKLDEISSKLTSEFSEKYVRETEAAKQASIDTIFSVMPKKNDYIELYTFSSDEFAKLWSKVPDVFSDLLKRQSKMLNTRYSEYMKPLSDSDCNKLSLQILNLMKEYELVNNSNMAHNPDEMHLIYATFLPVKNKANSVYLLRDHVRTSLKDYGASAKIFLDKNISKAEKFAKLEQFMFYELNNKSSFIMQFNSVNPENLKYIKENIPEIYEIIKNNVIPYLFRK